jgi:hypothetical protein
MGWFHQMAFMLGRSATPASALGQPPGAMVCNDHTCGGTGEKRAQDDAPG